ncbi:MAG: hypothetical protein R2743_19670 [Ilumatobacteraceae bacterium]
MLVTASHSPLIEFPADRSDSYVEIVTMLDRVRQEVEVFDPDLVILFGVDHYGGHHMRSMAPFCVGVEATGMADVGGTPGELRVPKDVAVGAVNFVRAEGVDVAVSYAMDVDHGFTQALSRVTGGVDQYPVLPIFVSCIQPPFVPFARARALGEAVGRYIRHLNNRRVLVLGTGGLTHNPRRLFPPIDEVAQEWLPYHLHGKAQQEVAQQDWIDYQIDAHHAAAKFLASPDIPDEQFGLHDEWDRAFLDMFCAGDMSVFDDWEPEHVVTAAGIGAMEVLSWIAAAQAAASAAEIVPFERLQQVCRVIGIGYGITTSSPTEVSTGGGEGQPNDRD